MAERGGKPHLRKRGARSWGLTHRDASGRTVETTLHADTKTAARKLADDYLALQERIRLGLESAIKPMTIEEAFAEYRKTAEAKPSWSTEEGRWRIHILDLDESGKARSALAKKMMHATSTHDIEVLLLAKHREGYSPQQVRHIKSHVRRLFTWAIRDARILRGENPCSFAKLPEEVPEPQPKAMSADQLEQLFNFGTDDPDELLLLLVATFSGERRKELIWMIWPNVDEEAGWFHVENSARVKTKTRRSRDVPIHPVLLPYLRAARRRARSEFVFPGKDGNQRPRFFSAAGFLRSRMIRAGLVAGFQLSCRKRGMRKNPRQKLTLEKAREIRKRSKAGETMAALARAFEVTPRAISLILSGKNYPEGFKPPGKCGWVAPELIALEAVGSCPVCGGPLRCKPVALPFAFKDLRSSFGTHATETAGSIAAVSKMLGHASEDTTRRSYLKQRTDHVRAAMQRVHIVSANKLPTADAFQGPLLPSTTDDDPSQPLN